jgi:hypothetical protein
MHAEGAVPLDLLCGISGFGAWRNGSHAVLLASVASYPNPAISQKLTGIL